MSEQNGERMRVKKTAAQHIAESQFERIQQSRRPKVSRFALMFSYAHWAVTP